MTKILFSLLALSIASIATAEESVTPTPAFDSASQPCKEDRAKFCDSKKMKEGGLTCLLAHEAELSPACQARMDQFETKHPCFQDRQTYCAGLKLGAGLGKCMMENRAKMGASCQARLDEKVQLHAQKRAEKRAARKASKEAAKTGAAASGSTSAQ